MHKLIFLICVHLLNYLRPFWHNIQCIYYITYYTVYLCDIYTHTHARTHACTPTGVCSHTHTSINKQYGNKIKMMFA